MPKCPYYPGVLSGLSEKNVPDPCYLCNQAKKCGIQKCSCCVKRKSSYRHIPYHLANTKNCTGVVTHFASKPTKQKSESIGVEVFLRKIPCAFLMVLGNTWIYLNNYRTSLATTQQYERRLVLIAASRGHQRERSRQAMTAAKGQGSETFV